MGANNYSPLQPASAEVNKGAKNFLPLQKSSEKPLQPLIGTSRTIGSIIRGFKIGTTKQIAYAIWQCNYYEHIIRNANDYARIAEYITNNPIRWEMDRYYT
jgi:REP element-mobilizing transposase RayT